VAEIVFAAFVPAALNSAGVHSDIRVGSVGAWLWLCGALVALGALRGGRPAWLVGVAAAIATLVKTTPAPLILWLWWRGARRAAVIAIAIVVIAQVPAAGIFGTGIFADWVRDGILGRLAVPSGWAQNQSLDAALLRLFVPAALEEVSVRAPLAKTVLSILLSTLVAVVTTVALSWRRPCTFAALQCGLVVLATLVVTPITWVHTLTALLFVWPVQVLLLHRAALDGAGWAGPALVASCAGFFLSSAHLPILWGTWLHHG